MNKIGIGTSTPIALPNGTGGTTTSLLLTQATWNGSLSALGLKAGDQVQLSVQLQTQDLRVQSAVLSGIVTINTDAPKLTSFNYSKYFSTHMNIQPLAYSMGSNSIGIAGIYWRVRDLATGTVLKDWTGNYTQNSFNVLTPFSVFTTSPANGQTIFVEVKAMSQTGILSTPVPSTSILIDQTEPAVSFTRPAVSGGGQNPYSNGQGGEIGGWSLTTSDALSGIQAYEVMLVPAATVNGTGFTASTIWSGATYQASYAAPGQTLQLQNISVPGVIQSSIPVNYYAFVQVMNGTGDWAPAVQSILLTVDQTLPVIKFVYPTGPNGVFLLDHQGNPMTVKVTNNTSQLITVTSSKASTSFGVSVNGMVWSSQPSTVNGNYNNDTTVNSWGTFVSSGSGTPTISVTGIDLYGNKVTQTDRMRFNIPASISLNASNPLVQFPNQINTTAAQVLNLEQLVTVVILIRIRLRPGIIL